MCRRLLIVAPPGPFRDGLRILLQAEPRITQVVFVDTLAAGCDGVTQLLPNSIIIDADLPDPTLWSFCTWLKTLPSPPRRVVITHNQDQRAAAQALGLPTLLAGFTTEALFDAIFGEHGSAISESVRSHDS